MFFPHSLQILYVNLYMDQYSINALPGKSDVCCLGCGRKQEGGLISCFKQTGRAYFREGYLIESGHLRMSPVDWACLVTEISPLLFSMCSCEVGQLSNQDLGTKILVTGMKIFLYETSNLGGNFLTKWLCLCSIAAAVKMAYFCVVCIPLWKYANQLYQ